MSTLPGIVALLPEGFALPSWPYLAVLVVGLAGVVAMLWAIEPPVTDRTIVALGPWMATGGVLHALYVWEDYSYPDWAAPLFGSPSVYATTAIVAGIVWIGATFYAAMAAGSPDRPLGVIGTAVAITFAMLGLLTAFDLGTLSPFWPTIAFFVAGVVTVLVWIALGLTFTDAVAVSSWTGALVVFSHALDGISTAVGFDVLGAGERTPLSRVILEAGQALPTAEFVGAGWLFVLVKILLAGGIVVLFKEWLREDPRQARLVLAFVAAVGLGPGAHNLMLFAIGGV